VQAEERDGLVRQEEEGGRRHGAEEVHQDVNKPQVNNRQEMVLRGVIFDDSVCEDDPEKEKCFPKDDSDGKEAKSSEEKRQNEEEGNAKGSL